MKARMQVRERQCETDITIFYNLTLEVTYHYLCHIVLVGRKSQVLPTLSGSEYQEVGSTGGPLRGYLPLSSSAVRDSYEAEEEFEVNAFPNRHSSPISLNHSPASP